MPLLDLQVRFRELGRIRAGEKGSKGEPRKLQHFRLTSASRPLLEQAASLFGGEVREWKGAPDEGFFELYTKTDRLDVMIPPVVDSGALLSQHYELWSGGGCVRRCDGLNEAISGKPCICAITMGQDEDAERECDPITRLSVMLPSLGGIGVWRLDTGGINAALELPGSFGLIVKAAEGQFMPAVLRLEQRSSKKEGQTRRYVVPVLDMEQATMLELVSGNVPGVLGPAVAVGRPELPAAGAPPHGEEAAFEHGDGEPAYGEAPALPADAHPELSALHDELVELVSELGATDSLPLIERKTEIGDKDWLTRQIASARQTLAARATETEGASPQGGSEMTPSESPLSPEAPSAVDVEPSLAPDLDTVTIPDGEHKGLTLAEIVAKGPSGERWIRWALRHPDSKSVGPEVHAAIEAYTSQPELVEA